MEGINIWVVGPYVFSRAFNPQLADYDPEQVEAYFHDFQAMRDDEFVAWRDYFFPGQNRCDACFFRRLDCPAALPGDECANCASSGRDCLFTTALIHSPNLPINTLNQPFDLPSPSNLLPPSPGGNPPQEPAQAAQDKGKGIEIVTATRACDSCIRYSLDDCDMDADLNLGCTSCRKLDTACQYSDQTAAIKILTPRPDGMVPPLCCDGCVHPPNGIQSCSWRRTDSDILSPCDRCLLDGIVCTYVGVMQSELLNAYSHLTHFSRTQQLPIQRPEHLVELFQNPQQRAIPPSVNRFGTPGPSTSQNPSNSQGAANNRRTSGFGSNAGGVNPGPATPGPVTPGPATPGPSSQRRTGNENANRVQGSVRQPEGVAGRPARTPCRTCATYPPTTFNYKRCNWVIQGDPNNPGPDSVQMGCTLCRSYGIICVVQDGIALPPCPRVPLLRRPAFAFCNPCKLAGLRCDRQRPCDACVTRGIPNECTGGTTRRGVFDRGCGYGTELYTYRSIMGGGIAGVNDPNRFTGILEQPADIHLQYISWLEGGPFPVPPGYPLLDDSPPRRDVRLRALPFPLPIMPHQAGNDANDAPLVPIQPTRFPRRPGQARNAPVVQQQPPAAQPPAAPQPAAPQPAAPQPATPQPATPQPQQAFPPQDRRFSTPQPQQPFTPQAQQPFTPQAQQPFTPQAQQPFTPQAQQPFTPQAQQPFALEPIQEEPFNPAAVFDILDDGEQALGPDVIGQLQGYQDVWNTARQLANIGQVIDLVSLRANLRQALFTGIPVEQSAAALPYLNQNAPLDLSRPIPIPFGVDENEVAILGLGARVIYNVGQGLQRPTTPPPVSRLYEIEGLENIPGDLNIPEGNPEHVNINLIAAQRPAHPDILNIPALHTIPSFNLFNQAIGVDLFCTEIKPDGNFCLANTRSFCEDLTHDANYPTAVCDTCNVISRGRFEQQLAGITVMMRAYACADCAMTQSIDTRNYEGRRLNVWGLQPGTIGEGEFASSSRGPALRLTGCACATKLLDRRICTPHRVAHFLEMRTKAQNMRNFVTSILGRMVCPFCLARSGTDAYNFTDENGVEFQRHAYACMACYGIVVADAVTHAAGINEAVRLMNEYTVSVQEFPGAGQQNDF